MADDERVRQVSRTLYFTAFAGAGRVIDAWVMDRIAPHLDERDAPAGTVLFREGELPTHVFFMQNGRVSLSRQGADPLEMRGKWLIGGIECAIEMPRTRTATVLDATHFVTVPAAVWHDIFEDSFEITRTAFFGTLRGISALFERLIEKPLVVPRQELSFDLPRGKLDLVERLLALSGARMFSRAGMQTLTDLAEDAEENWFDDETGLTSNVDPRGHLVLEGEILAQHATRGTTLHFLPGAATPPGLANWRMLTKGRTRTLSFSPEKLVDEMEEHTDLVRSVLWAVWEQREWALAHVPSTDGVIALG
jgi:CRP-like cAMP-binding protein